jgi:hypothetical protein
VLADIILSPTNVGKNKSKNIFEFSTGLSTIIILSQKSKLFLHHSVSSDVINTLSYVLFKNLYVDSQYFLGAEYHPEFILF